MTRGERTYLTIKIITYISYFIMFTNLSIFVPKVMLLLPSIIAFVVSLVLIYKYNPFSTYEQFTRLDKYFIFDAAVFIFISTVLSNWIYFIYV